MTPKMTYQVDGYTITHEVREITPQEAGDILATKNTKNRSANKNHVNALTANMLNGTWRYNADPIRFDANGTLIDGQHRLMALGKAGKTMLFHLVHGLDPESIKAIDMNEKARKLHDLLTMDGITQAVTTASIVTRYFIFSSGLIGIANNTGNGRSASSAKISKDTTIENQYDFYYEHKELIDEVVKYSRKMSRSNNLLTPSEVGGIFLFLNLTKHHDFDMIKDFFDQLFIGSQMVVINKLRNIIMKDNGAKKKMLTSHKQCYIAKAWNYFVRCKDVLNLTYTYDKEGPIEFI